MSECKHLYAAVGKPWKAWYVCVRPGCKSTRPAYYNTEEKTWKELNETGELEELKGNIHYIRLHKQNDIKKKERKKMTFKNRMYAYKSGKKVFSIPSLNRFTFGRNIVQMEGRFQKHQVYEVKEFRSFIFIMTGI